MLTNIPGSNVCQLQTSLTPVNLVHLAIFTIPLKLYYPFNLPCVFGILAILIHTHLRLTIQYNPRSLIWNYIWILFQKFMN